MSIIYEDDTWSVREISAEGAPLLVRTRCQLPPEDQRARYASLVLISWPLQIGDNGATSREEERATIYFEDALEAAIEQRDLGVLVVALASDAGREWRYYTDDTERFLDAMNAGLQGHAEYPLDIALYDDPAWGGLSEFVAEEEHTYKT